MIFDLILMILFQAILWLTLYLMPYTFLIFLENQLGISFKNKFKISGIFACVMCLVNLLLITLGYQ